MDQRPDEMMPRTYREVDGEADRTSSSLPERAADHSSETNVADLRHDIGQTRRQLSHTIDALQERLNPTHLKEQAQDKVRQATIGRLEDMAYQARETGKRTGSGIMDTLRENPIPTALVGLGLGWLFFNRSSGPQYRYADYRSDDYAGYRHSQGGVSRRFDEAAGRVGDTAHSVTSQARETMENVTDQTREAVENVTDQTRETVENVTEQARETMEHVAGQVRETGQHLAYRTQYQAERLENRLEEMWHGNPLGTAMVAVAVGAAVGMAIPSTQREHEIMGEARDSLVERARVTAEEKAHQVQEVADEAMHAAEVKAREQGLAH